MQSLNCYKYDRRPDFHVEQKPWGWDPLNDLMDGYESGVGRLKEVRSGPQGFLLKYNDFKYIK